MKFGEKPLHYNFSMYNHEKEPLKPVIDILKTSNWILERFENDKATGDKYGYYLLTHNLLIATQSLKKCIQFNDYNLLECLFRQSVDLLISCELIFTDISEPRLIQAITKERLKLYAAYCLWSRLNLIDIELNSTNYTPKDKKREYSDPRTSEFIEERSKEFHELKTLMGILKLNAEISLLDTRTRNGENLYSFVVAVNSSYSSISDYIRKNFSPTSAVSYSKAASRLHGTLVSIHPDRNTPNQLNSCLHSTAATDFQQLINTILSIQEGSLRYILRGFSVLWPNMLK